MTPRWVPVPGSAFQIRNNSTNIATIAQSNKNSNKRIAMPKVASPCPDNLLTVLPNGSRIGWKIYTHEDKEAVKQLIAKECVKREPTLVALNMTEEEVMEVVDHYANAGLDNGISILAYDMDRHKICAAALQSGPYYNGAIPKYDCHTNSVKLNQINTMLNHIAQQIKIHANNRPFIYGDLVVVRPEYAGYKITDKLSRKFFELLGEKLKKFRYYSLFTSHYSARIHERTSECVYQVNYADYVDPISGERIFASIPKPHRAAKLLCKL